MYLFDHQLSLVRLLKKTRDLGVFHAMELPFVFGTPPPLVPLRKKLASVVLAAKPTKSLSRLQHMLESVDPAQLLLDTVEMAPAPAQQTLGGGS